MMIGFEVRFFQISLGEILSVVEAQPGCLTNRSLRCQQFGFSPNSRIVSDGLKAPPIRKISWVLLNKLTFLRLDLSNKNSEFGGHICPAPHPHLQVALLWECPCSVSTSKRSVGARASTLG